MSKVYDLALKTDFQDPDSLKEAMSQMAAVSDVELQEMLIITETPQSSHWRRAGSLARAEMEIRRDRSAKELAMRTTWISALVGIVGVVLGAILGAWLAAPEDPKAKPQVDQSVSN